MTKIPVAGVIWQTVHYLIGLQRLGYEVYYVETHASTPTMLMEHEEDDSSAKAAALIDRVLRRFDLGHRWAFLALHEDSSRCYGMSRRTLDRLYETASLLINLHGGTKPRPELIATDRLVYVETDPVLLQVELHENLKETIDFLEPHCAFFTFAENYGNADCGLPVQERFSFHPTRQPVVIDFWERRGPPINDAFTTVGNWKQPWRDVWFEGETYSWSKHHEFLKFLDLPERTGQAFELALGKYDEDDERLLTSNGWGVRNALEFSFEMEPYRDYIAGSKAEFTVAKDQNVRLRTGWFSDRSATYLAAGRPVISQDTGFSNVLRTGEGLLGFNTGDEAAAAVEQVSADYERHRGAAAEIAREYFSHDVVLSRLLSDVGVELARKRASGVARGEAEPLPEDTVIVPASRRPTLLPDSTIEAVMSRPVPSFPAPSLAEGADESVVVVTYDNLVFTRLCLESLLENTDRPRYEVIVVDNGSTDGTQPYLSALGDNHSNLRVLLNGENVGFARACNSGLALASGDVLVLLNNDTMVAPGWLARLEAKLQDPEVGLVGPVTNRIGNEAEVPAGYRTWGGFLESARERAETNAGQAFDIPTLTMFCLAMRREVYDRVGPIDERFEVGMLEDDDYSRRVREAGRRLVCVEDVLVHHFGETSFGKLVPTGEYAEVLEANKRRFEEKWGAPWQPYGRRPNPEYEALRQRIRAVVVETIPRNATVLVVSRGDDELLELGERHARHFPASEDGTYAGHHPADSGEAVSLLEAGREGGGDYIVFPRTGLWWLEHYKGLEQHLESRYSAIVRDQDTCLIFALNGRQ